MEYKLVFEIKTEKGIERREVIYHLGPTSTVHDALLLFQERYDFHVITNFTLEAKRK